jgi:chromosome segregation ATPase
MTDAAQTPEFGVNELIKARGDLDNAVVTFRPIFEALQATSRVFDIMSNATVYQTALQRTVDDLVAEVDDLKAQRANWEAMGQASMERAIAAEAESDARVTSAHERAATAEAEAIDALAVQVAAAQADATTVLQEIATHVQAVQAQANTDLAAVQEQIATAQAEYDVLDKKLGSLKTSANKLAAALQG